MSRENYVSLYYGSMSGLLICNPGYKQLTDLNPPEVTIILCSDMYSLSIYHSESIRLPFSLIKTTTIKLFSMNNLAMNALAKRQFTIDTGSEKILVEGQIHKNVAIKYLMKRRRSLLMTKNPEKVENLWKDLPKTIKIIGRQLTREYRVNWELTGTEEFEGSRFVFTLKDAHDLSVAAK